MMTGFASLFESSFKRVWRRSGLAQQSVGNGIVGVGNGLILAGQACVQVGDKIRFRGKAVELLADGWTNEKLEMNYGQKVEILTEDLMLAYYSGGKVDLKLWRIVGLEREYCGLAEIFG